LRYCLARLDGAATRRIAFPRFFQIVSTIAPATGRGAVEAPAHLGNGLAAAAEGDQDQDEEGGGE